MPPVAQTASRGSQPRPNTRLPRKRGAPDLLAAVPFVAYAACLAILVVVGRFAELVPGLDRLQPAKLALGPIEAAMSPDRHEVRQTLDLDRFAMGSHECLRRGLRPEHDAYPVAEAGEEEHLTERIGVARVPEFEHVDPARRSPALPLPG